MTLVHPVPQIDADDARRLTERIRLIAGSVADNLEKLRGLVQQAKDSEVHVVLGYPSWTAYLKDVFGDEPLRLARDVRQELVAELAEQGLSVRAIAPIVGVSKSQVADDIAEVSTSGHVDRDLGGDAFASPDPLADVPEFWPSDVPDIPVDPVTGEVFEAGDEDDREVVVTETTVTEKTRTVTGLDGKNYTTPMKPPTPRRSSLVEESRNAGWQLRKAVERIQRIVEDDRFGKNKAEVMAALQPHLDFADEVFTDL